MQAADKRAYGDSNQQKGGPLDPRQNRSRLWPNRLPQ